MQGETDALECGHLKDGCTATTILGSSQGGGPGLLPYWLPELATLQNTPPGRKEFMASVCMSMCYL